MNINAMNFFLKKVFIKLGIFIKLYISLQCQDNRITNIKKNTHYEEHYINIRG